MNDNHSNDNHMKGGEVRVVCTDRERTVYEDFLKAAPEHVLIAIVSCGCGCSSQIAVFTEFEKLAAWCKAMVEDPSTPFETAGVGMRVVNAPARLPEPPQPKQKSRRERAKMM